MTDITTLPPLMVSQGGFTFNGEHIEYWHMRADVAERRHAQHRAIVAKLVEAADVLLDEYILLHVETTSTDPEKEIDVIAMRAAINEAKDVLK